MKDFYNSSVFQHSQVNDKKTPESHHHLLLAVCDLVLFSISIVKLDYNHLRAQRSITDTYRFGLICFADSPTYQRRDWIKTPNFALLIPLL